MELTINNRSVLDGYWDQIKNLSDAMKLALISRLSNSLLHSKSKEEAVDIDGIVGMWADDGFPTEQSIHAMRKSRHTINEL